MDGARCLKWFAFGCVLAGAVGCNRNVQQPSPFGQIPNTVPASGPLANAKSTRGGSTTPATVPTEMTPPVSNKPASADAIVAISDVRLDAAFDEKTVPGSKEAMLDLAREGYQKALKQEPKNKSALLGIARFYAKIGEKEKAVEAYKKYLAMYPNDASAAHEIAMVHARWKDWTGACAWCESTLKIDPENRNVKKTFGFCLARAGKRDEALAMLCQIMPEAQARHNLAGLLDHMGHVDASKQQLQLAVKADPNYAPARDFLAELDTPRTADPNGVRQASDQQPVP